MKMLMFSVCLFRCQRGVVIHRMTQRIEQQTLHFITLEMGGKGCVLDTTKVCCVKDT